MALTKITNDLLDLGSDTGALGLPKGTEAQRPSNPVEGTLRHNSEIDETKLETYNGTEWRKINEFVPLPYEVDFLVVAGGGGTQTGPYDEQGGSGAGGLRTSYGTSGRNSPAESKISLSVGNSYSITVGAGGSNSQGSNSSLSGSDITLIESIGGGTGASFTNSGGSGGCGGANWRNYGTAGSGTIGQGFDATRGTNSSYGSGGGAGAGATNTTGNNGGGNGGIGVSVSISGTAKYYSGGGGGAGAAGGNGGGDGGQGGGGAGYGFYGSGTDGEGGSQFEGYQNTGGGAGGPSAFGGSGIVILRMPTANYSGTTTGSPTVTTDGTDTILTYTSSGTYTA